MCCDLGTLVSVKVSVRGEIAQLHCSDEGSLGVAASHLHVIVVSCLLLFLTLCIVLLRPASCLTSVNPVVDTVSLDSGGDVPVCVLPSVAVKHGSFSGV